MYHTNIKIPVNVRATGEFAAVVHTGHKFDERGNIIKYGRVLRRTPFGRNKITLTGFNYLLGNFPLSGGSGGGGNIVMVAGVGNTAPAESDTVLASYAGKTSTHVSTVTTRNTTPDSNGDVMWRCTYRMTFNPTTLGTGFKNIAEAGIVMGGSVGSVTSSTPVGARGLLVDGGGSPTTVSLDADNEYLDLIWQYTEYVPATVSGSVNLTIDGVVTAHDYEVRPAWFDNVGGSFINRGWGAMGSAALPSFTAYRVGTYDASNANTILIEGPLAALSGANPSGTYVLTNAPITMTMAAYTTNSKQRTVAMTWTPFYGNIAGGAGVARVNMGHGQWQVSYDPVLAKTNVKQLDLSFVYSMANY